MKKLLVLLMILGAVGCSSKRTEPQPGGTPDPESTEGTNEDFTESKINIDLYKVDEYYPVVDGVVTYPDGSTEEFSNGEEVYSLDGSGKNVFRLYQLIVEDRDRFVQTKEGALQNEYPFYRENISDVMNVAVKVDIPENYNFVQSSEVVVDLMDGVFGIEMLDIDGRKIPYLIYRYSTHLPKGYELNDSFRIIDGGQTYYIWRIKEYDYLKGFYDETYGDDVNGRPYALWWGAIDGDSFNPHLFTFR